MSEIELKFLLDETSSKALLTRLKALKMVAARRVTLRSVYLDTSEHVLKKAGIALRIRRDGRRWIQTVKTKAKIHGGLSQVGEVENPAPGGRVRLDAIPDPSIREAILRHVNGAPLLPVCETVIKRSTYEVSLEDGTRAELAIDAGVVRAGERSAELHEAEIELLEGDATGLFDIARKLFPEGGLQFSELSKSARGYLLAEEGHIEPPLAARNAGTIAVEPDQIAEQAARDILRDCLGQIAVNFVVVRKLDDIEGPHQLRIGLRRLRSVFSVYKSALGSPEMARLSDDAKWLGQEVGSLRDLDVVAHDIVAREAALHPDEPGLSALGEALLRQAGERRDHVRTLLIGARAQAFLIDLAQFVETRGWLVSADFAQTERLAVPVIDLAQSGLSKCWKKVSKAAHGLETLTVEQRHALRKELKKLRYAVEFFVPLFPSKRLDPFLKRLKRLQTVFGSLNDAATVRDMFATPELPGVGHPAAQRAIGWVLGASQARAEFDWSRARALWRDLQETRLFWK